MPRFLRRLRACYLTLRADVAYAWENQRAAWQYTR